jgi:hypothetical protein
VLLGHQTLHQVVQMLLVQMQQKGAPMACTGAKASLHSFPLLLVVLVLTV